MQADLAALDLLRRRRRKRITEDDPRWPRLKGPGAMRRMGGDFTPPRRNYSQGIRTQGRLTPAQANRKRSTWV